MRHGPRGAVSKQGRLSAAWGRGQRTKMTAAGGGAAHIGAGNVRHTESTMHSPLATARGRLGYVRAGSRTCHPIAHIADAWQV
jgi:hypothetical protein